MRLTKKILILVVLLFTFFQPKKWVEASGLNIPDDSNSGAICTVTEAVDSELIQGSLRRAINQGYNITDSRYPFFCREKITFKTSEEIKLTAPLILSNKAASGFILEKAADVQSVTLNAEGLGAEPCAIVIDSNNVHINGITIKNPPNAGICIKNGSTENTLDQVKVMGGTYGVIVENGSSKNTIQNGSFYNNKNASIKLEDTNQNRVTKNGLQVTPSPIESSAIQLQATIETATTPDTNNVTQWRLTGFVNSPVDHCEIFKNDPTDTTTNYIGDISTNEININRFDKIITAAASDNIFLICIDSNGTTSPSSVVRILDPEDPIGTGNNGNGNGQNGGGTGQAGCANNQRVTPDFFDTDGDGITDGNEDKNKNCRWDQGVETNFGQVGSTNAKDTDGDGLEDGLEDSDKDGTVKTDPAEPRYNETDPKNPDSDGDQIPDGTEDFNHNGFRDPLECNPRLPDTDGDLVSDLKEAKENGQFDPNETKCFYADTDEDGLSDGVEDENHNGIWDEGIESSPINSNTDDDTLPDGRDDCPYNAGICHVPCKPNEERDTDLDNDGDHIPDVLEDRDNDCQVGADESDPFDKDTDNDRINDDRDPFPKDLNSKSCIDAANPGVNLCRGICNPEIINEYLDWDQDGKSNQEEDNNSPCNVDPGESDPFNPDSDGDGTNDGNDPCPLDVNPLCQGIECRVGVRPPETQDSDNDGIPDLYEDINNDCDNAGPEDVNETDFRKRDTDADGKRDDSDPCPLNNDPECVKECIEGDYIPPQRDSDRDGIKDIIEDGNRNCIREVSETDAYNNDTDGDGLADGMEDLNHNGTFDADETDPRDSETDGDGILDGTEDRNHNGRVDFDELSPLTTDSDGDGISDFLEDKNLNGIWDAASETNGAQKDTDHDGLLDGEEDTNHNGTTDAGETSASLSDTDGDTVNDGQEVDQGTNPLIPSERDLNRAIGKGCSLNPAATPSAATFWIFGSLMFSLVGFRVRRKA